MSTLSTLSILLFFHGALFRAGLLLSLILGVWGLLTHFRKGTISPGYRSTVVLTVGLFIAQGLMGVGMLLSGGQLRDKLHILYGVLLVIALPIAAGYGGGNNRRREALAYGVAGLVMVALVVRAVMTSGS